jgi:dephospho-CoA kinase
MLKVGLTGGIASGKTTVCDMFSTLHVPIIDADIIAKQLTSAEQPCFQQIVDCFGDKYIKSDGQLDRKQLRQLIFSDHTAKSQLEAILHPQIRQQLSQQAESVDADYCILSIPLLIEANMTDLVDEVLVIDIDPKLQLERLCHRDAISQQEASNIIMHQCDREQRNKAADQLIINDASTEHLQYRVSQLDKFYRQHARSQSKSCQ